MGGVRRVLRVLLFFVVLQERQKENHNFGAHPANRKDAVMGVGLSMMGFPFGSPSKRHRCRADFEER